MRSRVRSELLLTIWCLLNFFFSVGSHENTLAFHWLPTVKKKTRVGLCDGKKKKKENVTSTGNGKTL